MRLSKLFQEFISSEKTGGLILVICTILSICLANSPWQSGYIRLWQIEFYDHNLVHWINDGLMTIFFLLIGLELKREVTGGELSEVKNVSLPVLAATGGMLIPAGIYFLFNIGTGTLRGVGIPMATDIAFAIGILSLLGKLVPASLKVFLTALAVIDDLGAIIVIAVFYTGSLAFEELFISLGIFCILIVLNRLGIRYLIIYIAGGVGMWYYMMHSGVHPTISGVLTAFAIPFGANDKKPPAMILEHLLNKPVAFAIIPLFALCNTCITLGSEWHVALGNLSSLGIIAGLVIGKPLGIYTFSRIGAGFGLCDLPRGLKWRNLLGTGFLGGIGFTMSIFITLLAFDDPVTKDNSKIAIILSSLLSGIIGFMFLRITLKKQIKPRLKNRQVI
jgi:NhaA family Na+:H+ antiporter